ncbi:pyridoxamine 5'-phosphate oxidase family protein [Pseudorhodoferax sp. Leaf274]|uniref:pyridoxamine 5'-phosphate oxidase family protein n=1 Tax=Pseudorhodoferax sp. Leaf274 TaxID=1736318 RepID=UPI001F2FC645|nr:pyridoxamine 5'-phosphate oxidase family protein [Pseudorhodoferax sp. Leaf274]
MSHQTPPDGAAAPAFLNNTMRRTDLAWSDWPAIRAFLRDEMICRVAIHDDPFPYVVAQSFTFLEDRFLIHCSRFGKMAELLRANPNVTIEVDRPVALLKAPKGQNTSLEYYSVIARCELRTKQQIDEIRPHQYLALDKFRPEKDYTPLEDGALQQIVAFEGQVKHMSAKKRILSDGQYSPPGQPRAPYLRYAFAEGAVMSALPDDAFDRDRFKK